MEPNIELRDFLIVIGIIMGIALLLALLLLGWVVWRVKRINLPENADLFTALRLTPLSVVILIDLLDLSLDFLSAPISWGILSWLGLKPLRGITVVEALFPGTQVLPLMTAMWVVARLTRGRLVLK